MFENQEITAGWSTLTEQAGWTAKLWMSQAVADIDEMFGPGYAKANPTLITAFMNAAATDMHGAHVGIGAQKIAKMIEDLTCVIQQAGWDIGKIPGYATS